MRKLGSVVGLTLFLAGLFASLPTSTAAQDQDPPGRVARLNYIQGSVSYQVSGDQDWVQADQNRPLTAGDNLWVDKDSRGEVHIGSTAIRMDSETGISFLTLDDRTVQLQLAQGTIEVHLRDLEGGDAFEIDTPNLALTLTRSGEYRVQTDPNGGSTVIVVREGQGQVSGGTDTWDLRSGQQYAFNGTDDLSYAAYAEPGFDDFENWCESRDDRENNAPSAKYVSRDVDGYYDLDEYGDWRPDADYGTIWVPRGVAVGWAPYHSGHWVYIAPWGWTWVDDAPWGFAPFHYGRWVFVRGYWGWVPGPVVVRPVYAPALVAFVGGGNFSLSVSFGGGLAGVAWFPLGPRDVYVPGYRCSPRYVQTINITNTRVINVTQVTNVYNTVVINHNTTIINNYTYARNETAVTAVSRDTFVNARPVSRGAIRVTPQQLQSVRPVDSAPIAPGRTSYVASTARVSQAKPAVPFSQRPVVARMNPAVSRPVMQPNQNNQYRTFVQPQRVQPAPQGGNRPNQGGQNNRINQPNAQQNAPQQGNQQQNAEQQQPRGGFRPFTPQGGNQQPPQQQAQPQAQQQQQMQQQQYNRQPPVRFTPPAKASDERYDVHPPLNQRQNQQQAQPPRQQEEHRNPPQQQNQNRSEQHDNKHDDNKH